MNITWLCVAETFVLNNLAHLTLDSSINLVFDVDI
jgi:hypothetical protein